MSIAEISPANMKPPITTTMAGPTTGSVGTYGAREHFRESWQRRMDSRWQRGTNRLRLTTHICAALERSWDITLKPRMAISDTWKILFSMMRPGKYDTW